MNSLGKKQVSFHDRESMNVICGVGWRWPWYDETYIILIRGVGLCSCGWSIYWSTPGWCQLKCLKNRGVDTGTACSGVNKSEDRLLRWYWLVRLL